MSRGKQSENSNFELRLTDNYKVTQDSLNYILCKRNTIKGEGRGRKTTKAIGTEYWTNIAYYGDIPGLLHGLVRHEIFDTGINDLKALGKKVDELYALINKLEIPREMLR